MSVFGQGPEQSQKGGQGNTQNIGVPPEQFERMLTQAKDELRSDLEKKFKESRRADAAERKLLERDIADLQARIAEYQKKLADPATAYRDHRKRETLIESLLQDTGHVMQIGQNRIHSALEAFKDLVYEEIDALLAETEQRGIMIAANAAYGRGTVAEDAGKWADAAAHYTHAAQLNPTFDTLFKARELASRAGQLGIAVRLAEELLAHPEAQGETARRAIALNEHALTQNALGRFAEAEVSFRQALEIDRATIGDGHPNYAVHLNNLAGVVRAQGRFADAEHLFRQALAIDQTTIGEEHPDYAIDLSNLAGAIEDQGRFSEAEGLYRQALEIGRATIGERHPDYATHLNNLAGVVRAQGRFSEAEDLCRQAFEIDLETIGKVHPDYAIRLNNLAGAIQAQGRFSEAEDLYRQALEITQATVGEGHPAYATRLNNLAVVAHYQVKNAEALDLLTQALAIREATLPVDHPDIAQIKNNIAAVEAAMRD